MILTAIVITLGMAAFLLALAYRSWQLNGDDLVQDDVEDRRIADVAHREDLRAELRSQRAEYRAERRPPSRPPASRKRELRESLREARRELRARTRLQRAIAARSEDYEYLEEETESDTDFERPPEDHGGAAVNALVPLPVLLPLFAVGVKFLLGPRRLRAQNHISLAVLSADTVISSVLLVQADHHGPLVVQVGWLRRAARHQPRRGPLRRADARDLRPR